MDHADAEIDNPMVGIYAPLACHLGTLWGLFIKSGAATAEDLSGVNNRIRSIMSENCPDIAVHNDILAIIEDYASR